MQLRTPGCINKGALSIETFQTISCGFKIITVFITCVHLRCTPLIRDFLKKTRKAPGFKSLRVNCWEANQVTSKSQMDFLDKTCEKGLKKKK